MQILIAGCGYVGVELARQLMATGHTVVGLRRNTAGLPQGIVPLAADLMNPATLRPLPDGIESVVYAASADAYTEESYQAAYHAGLGNLLEALSGQQHLRRILFVSSTGVYAQDDGSWLDEDSPAAAGRPTARVLLEGEALLRNVSVPAVVVRFSGIYGPGRTRLIDSVVDGSARLDPGDSRYLNHIHRDDCAGILAHLLSVSDPAPLYLGTDCAPQTRNDLLCWIAGELGMPEPPEATEPSAGRGGNRRYRNQRLLDGGYTFAFPTFREGYGALLPKRRSS